MVLGSVGKGCDNNLATVATQFDKAAPSSLHSRYSRVPIVERGHAKRKRARNPVPRATPPAAPTSWHKTMCCIISEQERRRQVTMKLLAVVRNRWKLLPSQNRLSNPK